MFYDLIRINIYLRLIFSSLVIFFMPGYLMYRLLFLKEKFDIFEKLPIIFCLSFSLLVIPGCLIFLFHLKLDWLLYALAFLAFLLIAANSFRYFHKREVLRYNPKNSNKFPLVFLCLTLLIIFFAILSAKAGGFLSRDGLTYLGYIRKIVELPTVSVYEPFYNTCKVDPARGYNIWFLTLGLLSYLSKIDPIKIWVYLPAFLVPLSILAVYTFSKTIFLNRYLATFCAGLFAVYYGIYNGMWVFRFIEYPNLIGNLIFLPIGLTLAIRYFQNKKKIFLIFTALIVLVTASIHIFSFVLLMTALCSYVLFYFLFRRTDRLELKRMLFLLLVVIIVVLPYLILRFSSYEISNECYFNPFFAIIRLSPGLFYRDPMVMFSPEHYARFPYKADPFYFAAFILIIPLLFYVRKSNAAIFLFANMVIPSFIMLNPLFCPLLASVMTNHLVRRFGQILPFLLLLAFFLFRVSYSGIRLMAKLKASINFNRGVTLTALMAGLIIFSVIPENNHKLINLFKKPPQKEPFYEYAEKERAIPVLNFMQKNIKKPQVIFSNYSMGILIPAYTKHYVMVADPVQVSAGADDQMERMYDANNVLDSGVDIEETIRLLKKYDVKFLVLDKKYMFYKSWNKFAVYPNLFTPVFEENELAVFKFNPGQELLSNSVEALELSEGPNIKYEVSGDFAHKIEIIGYNIDREQVRPGQEIRMVLYWKSISFTSESYRISLVFDNFVRGELKRFCINYLPCNGWYSTNLWRKGEVIKDEHHIFVPYDTPDGIYDIFLGIENSGRYLELMDKDKTERYRIRLGKIKVAS